MINVVVTKLAKPAESSDILVECLNRIGLISCGPWFLGVRSTLSVSLASRPPRCCGLYFPSSDTNMVNFHIEYVFNFKIYV